MALDKLVDSTQLDADLTSVADAIRAKSGGSSQLAFPAEFVSEIGNISGGGGPHEVPDGYTQLKYLKSSGTQAINTGVAPTIETQFQVQAFVLEGNGSYYPIAGCANPLLVLYAPATFKHNAGYNSFGNVGDKTIPMPWPSDSIPVFTINKTEVKYTVDGFSTVVSTSLGATTMSGSSDTRIFLFARGNAGNFERMSRCQMYRAKIWDNGTLIRDFVPAKRNSDDVLGMYDIVNDVFYTNAGTGDFIGGEYE